MKIFVLGEMLSGKSTLAQNLATQFNLPYIISDVIKAKCEKLPCVNKRDTIKSKCIAELKDNLSQNSSWIIEGIHVWIPGGVTGEYKPDIVIDVNPRRRPGTAERMWRKRAEAARIIKEKYDTTGVLDTSSTILPAHYRGTGKKEFEKFMDANKGYRKHINEYTRNFSKDPDIKIFRLRSYRAQTDVFDYIRQIQSQK